MRDKQYVIRTGLRNCKSVFRPETLRQMPQFRKSLTRKGLGVGTEPAVYPVAGTPPDRLHTFTTCNHNILIPKGQTMKRFFCTVCGKVKRVQRWPVVISNDYGNVTIPQDRIGQCNYHITGRTRLTSTHRTIKKVKSSTPPSIKSVKSRKRAS